MLLVTKVSVTMPCETHLLEKLKIPMAVYILPAKGNDPILCYPGFPVDATRWRLSQAGNILHLRPFSQSWKWDVCFRCMQLQVLIFLGNL